MHTWVSCDDGCSTCLICGGHWYDARIDAGDYARCTGATDQVHGDGFCETCQTDEPCPHHDYDCDCDFCR